MSYIILGIDPGTVNTGYGLVRVTEHQIKCLDYGLISAGSGAFGSRIHTIQINRVTVSGRNSYLGNIDGESLEIPTITGQRIIGTGKSDTFTCSRRCRDCIEFSTAGNIS